MKKIIERTLFWFVDGDDKLISLNERYFSLGVLLNRLLSKNYNGKRIQFINIFFRTGKSYELHPQAPKYYIHFYNGHLSYDDVFDLESFNNLPEIEQDHFIWKRAYEILTEISESIKNEELKLSSKFAYNEGLQKSLNPDYKLVEKEIVLFGQNMDASIWVNFKSDGMYSKFSLDDKDGTLFEKHIDKAKNGIEFFLEMYKDIELKKDSIVIKGRSDVEYLPLKIPLTEIKLKS